MILSFNLGLRFTDLGGEQGSSIFIFLDLGSSVFVFKIWGFSFFRFAGGLLSLF